MMMSRDYTMQKPSYSHLEIAWLLSVYSYICIIQCLLYRILVRSIIDLG